MMRKATHSCQTGLVEVVEVPIDEEAALTEMFKEMTTRQAVIGREETARVSAAKKLADLGLTPDEIAELVR